MDRARPPGPLAGLPRTGEPPHDPLDLEARILQAGSFVRPSDDLRPQVLEAARAAHSDRRHQWRAASAVLAVAALLAVVLQPAAPLPSDPDASHLAHESYAPGGRAPRGRIVANGDLR